MTQTTTDSESQNGKKGRSRALLSLGSNLGDRSDWLRKARTRIIAGPETEILRASSELENRALLDEDQPDFINQIVEIETPLGPVELLGFVKSVESELGRKLRYRWGPREIDIDILLFNRETIQLPDLVIPHPGLRDRPYLQSLLNELGIENPFA